MATELVGQNVLISQTGTAIGTQRNATVTFEIAGIDISSKASIWQKLTAGRRKVSGSCDGILSTGAGGSAAQLTTMLLGALVTMLFEDSVSGDQITGSALITKWEAGVPDVDAATYNVGWESSGEWSYTPA